MAAANNYSAKLRMFRIDQDVTAVQHYQVEAHSLEEARDLHLAKRSTPNGLYMCEKLETFIVLDENAEELWCGYSE